MILTERLRALRQSRGWSYRELGQHCGLSHSNVYNVENGIHDTTLASLASIAAAYDMTLIELLEPTEYGAARSCAMCGFAHSDKRCPACGHEGEE